MSSLMGRLKVVARGTACVLAGVPSTALVPLPLTMALTKRYGREERLKRLHRMIPWARFCCRRIAGIRMSVAGKQHVPSPSKGYMYVSNHQSWADIVVLMDALDTVAFLSKDLVRYIPVVGRCAYAGGTIFFDRRTRESRRRALEQTIRMCCESTAVVLFPEGTRSTDGELREKIYPASIRAAFDHGLKVVPVGLDGSIEIMPKANDDFRVGQPVAVTIGPALDGRDFADADAFVEAVWSRVGLLFQQSRQRLRR